MMMAEGEVDIIILILSGVDIVGPGRGRGRFRLRPGPNWSTIKQSHLLIQFLCRVSKFFTQ